MADTSIGYCPYCVATLRVERETGGLSCQVVCRCRTITVADHEAKARGSLRAAWEVAVGLRPRYASV